MNGRYPNYHNCTLIAELLHKNLGRRVILSKGGIIILGKYSSFLHEDYKSYNDYDSDRLNFSCKCLEDSLMLAVFDNIDKKGTRGQKLAALNDFYRLLSNKFGEAASFYTKKNDDDNALNLIWDLSNSKNDKYSLDIDSSKIDELILFDKDDTMEFKKYKDDLKIDYNIDIYLPSKLFPLIMENRDDFIKYSSYQTDSSVKKMLKQKPTGN